MDETSINTLVYNSDLCISCEIYWTFRPYDVFINKSSKAEIVDRQACIECGAY
ncbi:MAG: hypothetical protein JSV32_07300 [Dehalococcoidia bacterium]|nr:MAG: hypothetical protein JSV32_07300 [Dehalococcoidia bacterium]